MKRLLCLTLLLASVSLAAQQPRHLLRTAWAAVDTASVRPASWKPYPAYSDRAAWNRLLSDGLAEQAIKEGEKWLDYDWPSIRASQYLEFERSGSRAVMEEPYAQNRRALNALIMAELAEGRGRFISQIIDGVWYFSGMPSWVGSAHEYRKDSGRSLPDYRDVIMDLFSQVLGKQIAVALYFFRGEMDRVDPSISAFAEHALYEKIYKPYLDPAKWRAQSWLGFTRPGEEKPYFWENWDPRNNWNIWCNFAVSYIACLACPDRGLLQRILATPAFAQAQVDTGFIERHTEALLPQPPVLTEAFWQSATCAYLRSTPASVCEQDRHSPWSEATGWRQLAPAQATLDLRCGGQTRLCTVSLATARTTPDETRLIARRGDTAYLHWQGDASEVTVVDALSATAAAHGFDGSLAAPMNGSIVRLLVSPGQPVEQGDGLVVLEAMKMEHTVRAHRAGVIQALCCEEGEMVNEGTVLIEMQEVEHAA